MNKPATFGRRDRASANAGPKHAAKEIALTPEQRAFLFTSETLGLASAPPAAVETRQSRHAGLIACLAVTALVCALTLAGKPQDSIAALPPSLADPTNLADPANIALERAGAWIAPISLAWSAFAIGSTLAANLWLTRKICAWRNWSGLHAFALVGAVMGVGVAFATSVFGLGETDLGYVLEAASGAGAAALYRVIAGRRAM